MEGDVNAPRVREVPLFDMRLRKFEVPIFKGEEGEDLNNWLHRVERYFVVNRQTEKDKLEAAVLCLEDEALSWLQWEEGREPFATWPEFRERLLERFQPPDKGDQYVRFLVLCQETTVKAYQRLFEQYVAALGIFLNQF